MVAIPVAKLFSLTVKTLAKPVSKRIKAEASKHGTLRGILHGMGQITNNISLRISIRMAGHKTTNIKPLDEEKAVAAGGELLAEGFVYSVAGTLVVWEYMSSLKDKEQKEEAAKLKRTQELKEHERKERADQARRARDRQEFLDSLQALDQRLRTLEQMQEPRRGYLPSFSAERRDKHDRQANFDQKSWSLGAFFNWLANGGRDAYAAGNSGVRGTERRVLAGTSKPRNEGRNDVEKRTSINSEPNIPEEAEDSGTFSPAGTALAVQGKYKGR